MPVRASDADRARAELERRRREHVREVVREPLYDFVPRITPDFTAPHHLAPIVDVLERCKRGEPLRVLISVPPQHGKSEVVLHSIPQLLGIFPRRQYAYVSYEQQIAFKKSGFARKYAERSGIPLKRFKKSQWETVEGGGFIATSIGGPLTGEPISGGLIIDDPFKNREEAESLIIRDNVHGWAKSTGFTRLHPTAFVIVVHCLTGDTPVLLADASTRALRDIRQGDIVASYVAGKLAPARVLNWANQGPDDIFALTTASGKIVRANARHPFLVRHDDGSETWTKVRDLKVGDCLLRAAPYAGLIAESLAAPMGAQNQRAAKDSATATIAAVAGQQVIARHPSAPKATALGTSSIAAARQNDSNSPLDIFAVEIDPIVDIVPAGREDVFDIQVEGTESFIANGLAVHNTRWHEDDLIGRLSKEMREDENGDLVKKWEVINLPAISNDGKALWPEGRPLSFLRDMRGSIGEYDFSALFQGRPRPRGHNVFRGVRHYDKLPNRYRIGKGLDLAYTGKNRADFSCAVVVAECDGDIYVLDVVHKRCDVRTFIPHLQVLDAKYPGTWNFICSGMESALIDLAPTDRIRINVINAVSDKFARAQPVAARWNGDPAEDDPEADPTEGRVFLPREAPWIREFLDEISTFTGVGDPNDDQVDALSSAFWDFKDSAATKLFLPPNVGASSGYRFQGRGY